MSGSDRLTAAATARHHAGVVRYAAHEQFKGSHQRSDDAWRLAFSLAQAEGFERLAKMFEKGQRVPVFLDDDKTPTVAVNVTDMKESE